MFEVGLVVRKVLQYLSQSASRFLHVQSLFYISEANTLNNPQATVHRSTAIVHLMLQARRGDEAGEGVKKDEMRLRSRIL